MPRLDGTGPMGKGPRTGRGMGNCSNCGGALRCYRPGCWRLWTLGNKASQTPTHSLEDLKAIKKQLEQDLADIDEDIKIAEKEE